MAPGMTTIPARTPAVRATRSFEARQPPATAGKRPAAGPQAGRQQNDHQRQYPASAARQRRQGAAEFAELLSHSRRANPGRQTEKEERQGAQQGDRGQDHGRDPKAAGMVDQPYAEAAAQTRAAQGAGVSPASDGASLLQRGGKGHGRRSSDTAEGDGEAHDQHQRAKERHPGRGERSDGQSEDGKNGGRHADQRPADRRQAEVNRRRNQEPARRRHDPKGAHDADDRDADSVARQLIGQGDDDDALRHAAGKGEHAIERRGYAADFGLVRGHRPSRPPSAGARNRASRLEAGSSAPSDRRGSGHANGRRDDASDDDGGGASRDGRVGRRRQARQRRSRWRRRVRQTSGAWRSLGLMAGDRRPCESGAGGGDVGRNRVVLDFEIGPKGGHGGHDDDRDQGHDEAVFNRRRAAFIANQA